MSALRTKAKIAWAEPLKDKRIVKAAVAADEDGRFALVRYLDVQQGFCTGRLWDLDAKTALAGDYVALHPSRALAIRRNDAKKSSVVDLDTGRPIREWPGHLDVAFAPDAPFVVQRPRQDTVKGGERPSLRVHALDGADIAELPTRSVLEAFVAGGRLASVGRTGAITLWDLATGEPTVKLPGLPKTASIRVDASGTKIGLSDFDGGYAVVDLESGKVTSGGKSRLIFVNDATFDGTRWLATNQLVDSSTKRHRSGAAGWMKGPRHGHEQTISLGYPRVAVLTQRELLGARVVELWDIDADRQLGTAEVAPRAQAIATVGKVIVTAHLPTEDEPTWPALTLLALRRDHVVRLDDERKHPRRVAGR